MVRSLLLPWVPVLVMLLGCGGASICGDGFREEAGTCVFDCEGPCGAHQECVETTDGGECRCVAGYAGTPCEWTGGLQDPEFTSPEVWSDVTNGATILPLAAGPGSSGLASFESSVVCNAGAVAQVVEMPPYDLADPFVVEIMYRADDVLGVEVGYNRAFRRLLEVQSVWLLEPERFCLGEAAYGGPVKFQVAASERLPDCFLAPIGSIEVDRFQILVADPAECPAPGEVKNGAANVDEGGWVFEVEDFSVGVTEAGLQEGVGQSGSSGARLYKPAGAENLAAMYTQLSVPLPSSLPAPALRFWWRGNPAWFYYVDLGTHPGTRTFGRVFDALVGDGTPQVMTYCLPPWTYGNVVDLSFILQAGRFADEAELVVDDVEIVSDPARCGDSTDLLDPSFDSAPYRWPGVRLSFEEEPISSVRLINDPGRAHPPGAGALELRYTNNRARMEAQSWVWVPRSEGDRGPQLTFYANAPVDPGLSVLWALGSSTGNVECVDEFCPTTPLSQSLPLGGGWQPVRVCLPAEWAERWFRFRVAIRPSEDPLEVFPTPRSILLDDFEVTLDEGCPPRR